ncbi:helix-turn-helix transcriptional regulator [Spirosoma endophyticum]|uniref:Transcriptional regulator, AraC family n=1 Tax=Spirosoma endophyticum TaxID=662367 RepID=A0A1I2DWN5_9BACT|nr:AraC family transcriptional regulator [Spirosoma endophyticum]SFE84350.1 transcriptional regulator, AraC family [Spirosoma endophyticum]
MVFEFTASPTFNFLTSFGKKFNIPVHGNSILLPSKLGNGTIRRVDLETGFKAVIHQYTLKEDFVLKRYPAHKTCDLVSLIFHGNEQPASLATPSEEVPISLAKTTPFAIQVSSYDLESVIHFPAGTAIQFVVVGITTERLRSLLNIQQPNPTVETILSSAQGFLFYQTMGPQAQRVLQQLISIRQTDELSFLAYYLRVLELLLLVFEQLLKRDPVRHRPIRKDDIDKLFNVRNLVLSDLSQPPKLEQLARQIGMNQTKLKDLFSQVFGDSIYQYYLKARMDEAAFLLEQGGRSVAEVGHQLGFTNLSHFSRLFKRHHGLSPKKYVSGG